MEQLKNEPGALVYSRENDKARERRSQRLLIKKTPSEEKKKDISKRV